MNDQKGTEMNTYTITKNYFSDGAGEEWKLHKGGCKDLDPTNHEDDTFDAPTAAQAARDWMDEEMTEMGWSVSDIRMMPCSAS